MGGVIDSGGGIGVNSSPHRAAIEKAQAELRQEYDVREERRRELEFLEKGGNPLDFKFGNGTSHSVQSTSFTDKQADHFLNSEFKDSFPRTVSPHGDSVETSSRPGVPLVSEPNTADNLLLFHAEKKKLEGDIFSKYPNKRNRTSESERSCKVNNFQNNKVPEDFAIFRPYARRNRSKINRDPARSSSVELVQKCGGLASSPSICKDSVDVKGSITEVGNNKNRNISSASCPSSATSSGNIVSESVVPSNCLNTEVDGLVVRESTAILKKTPVKENVDIAYRKNSADLASSETGLVTVSQESNFTHLNDFINFRGEKESSTNGAAAGKKELDRESSHVNNVEVDVDTKINLHRVEKSDSNRIYMQSASRVEGIVNPTVGEMANTKSEDEAGDPTIITNEQSSGHHSQTKSLKVENEGHRSTAEPQNENICCPETERRQQDDLDMLHTDMNVTSELAGTCNSSLSLGKSQVSAETSTCITSKNIVSGPGVKALKQQDSLDATPRIVDTLKENSILEEARLIKAKRMRIAELSCGTVPVELRTRSQWDFVLEEMAWLANDFAQERLWKMTAASQICHRVAFTSKLKFEERIKQRKMKSLASTLANAVLQFWSSVEVPTELEETSLGADKETWRELKCDSGKKCSASGVMLYARRFFKFVRSPTHLQIVVPSTPDNMCDPGILETSWDDQLTEESLFYSVPSCAMEAYRRSIESHLVWCEKSGSSMQEEVETSAYDTPDDTGYNGYDEDDEETSNYYLPGALECSKSFNLTHKKRKNSMKYHKARSYDIEGDLPYSSYTGGSNPLMGKRPANNRNVGSVPMKRMRTASRQRIVSPFGCDSVGSLPVLSKTDASSGDTSSFQDEQSSLNGESAVQKGIEVESRSSFEKQLPYDMAEMSGKPKKKKVSAYDHAWHPDSMVHGNQGHWKKRPENHFNKNGYGAHGLKKQKSAKQSVENNFDSSTPFTDSVPCPTASQMSNMSNPSKFIKFIGGRERGRKIKGLKISSGQQGSDNPWLLFEDQALVVLVHDMGPNWELISDAINSTLKIKCIYRNPSECKERHKILMDKSGGDGADSAEDSGNSQSYPSTLPGIPKGSARQLFQRLQGPVEEETLKSHFEKICLIGKKFHHIKIQNDGRDPKQIVPIHNSQVMALSHVFPNNLNGNVLTPRDLCDASTSGPDLFSFENPGGHPGVPVLNQGTSVLPASEANPIAGSAGVVLANNLSTTSGPISASTRFNTPRGSLPLNEQQLVQQYNQMLSGRIMQQPSLPTPGAVSGSDHGHSLVPGGNARSVSGTNMSSPLSKPGFQGVSALAVQNTGSMPSSGVRGSTKAGNINSVGSASQGKPTMRSREAMQHMMRMQAAKGNSQGIPALSSGFVNQTTPSAKAYPGHLPQQHKLSQQSSVLGNSINPHLQSPSHVAGAQQQAFAIRQRQTHPRYLQQKKQQQQQFLASGAMTALVQSQPQVLPVSSSPQNSPQTQPLTSPQPLTMSLSSNSLNMSAQHNPPKAQLVVHGLGRKPQSGVSGPNNQAGKQQQQQTQQQSESEHPHQSVQGQQQNNLLKGMGRGNIMHQSNSVDPTHLNGTAMSTGIQGTKKVEVTVQAVPGQPSNPLTVGSTHPRSKPLVPQQSSSSSQQQPKTFPGAQSHLSQHQQRELNSDNEIQGEVSGVDPGNILPSPSVTPAVAQPNHQHLLLHEKQGNQAQPISRRTVPQNHESLRKSESVTNTTQKASMGATKSKPQAGTDLVNTNAVCCTAVSSSPKELDLPLCDSSKQNAAFKVSSSIKKLTNGDPVAAMAQGLGLSPDGLIGYGHKNVIQRQQEQQLPEQLPVQNRKHIPSEQHQPYLKTLDLEALHEKSSSRPSDTKVE